MASRKLQTEIDKVLKKVAEGVETFEEIFDKIQTSTNTNQKEKYEADLKKEIKKLQRHRDQIKTWISSNDIKDKRALMDNRKLIEQQMEKFKACEKEMKTKAYSKEGLSMSARLDPKEKEKADLCGWVNDRVEALNIQIEGLEAEVETLQSGAKKKKDPSRERIIELEEKIERHKWHQGRLELILRLLENGQIDMEKVQAIQEDVNYYVDENTDPDFAEDEEIYEDLNLEEEEEFFGGVTPSAAAKDAEKDEFHDDFEKPSKDHKDEHEQPSKRQVKDPEPEPSPPRKPTKKPSMSEKDTKPTSTPTPTFVTKPTGTPVRPGPAPRTMSVDAPAVQYAAAAAANLPTESPKVTNATVVAASPKVTSAVASSTPIDEKPPSAPSSTIKSPITSAAATAAIVTPAAPTLPETQAASPQAATQTTSVAPTLADFKAAKEETSSAKETPSASAAPSPTVVLQEKAEGSPTLETATALQDAPQPQLQHSTPALEPAPAPASVAALGTAPVSQQQSQLHQPSTVESEIRLPAALADLAHSFEASKERALSKEMGFFVHQMLEASYQFVPEPMDTERPKFYQPKNPYPTPSYYPQSPPQGLFDSAAMFEKFDIDTLFFIFYYQQGTYQQYLAARELKKRSWRFHKNYLTWFQRHEEPKAITDDYEQGTYIYFDYEGAWCQRKKSDFRFEYKFLEDAELI